jgi:secreted trypsin-like serine protease
MKIIISILMFTGIHLTMYHIALADHNIRIVGGTTSENDAWPFIAALVDYYGQPQCGAALIHSLWVVTAAHCVENSSGGWVTTHYYDVVVGLNDMSKNQESYLYKIEQIIPHPNYDSYLVDNDIALLKLKTSVPSTFKPIKLYQGDVSGLTGIVLGWGNMVHFNPDDPSNPSYSPSYPDQLRQVEVPVVDFETCMESTTYQITTNMFCAGYPEGQKDACGGDSGGPFVVYSNYQWKLAGIVSWGEGCAWPGYYGFYTRVPNYISFINTYVPLTDDIHGDINHDDQIDLKDIIMMMNHLSDIDQFPQY